MKKVCPQAKHLIRPLISLPTCAQKAKTLQEAMRMDRKVTDVAGSAIFRAVMKMLRIGSQHCKWQSDLTTGK